MLWRDPRARRAFAAGGVVAEFGGLVDEQEGKQAQREGQMNHAAATGGDVR